MADQIRALTQDPSIDPKETTDFSSLMSSGQDNFFTGSFNDNNLYHDPFLMGQAVIIWTKIPKWVQDKFTDFENLTQKNFRGFDGLSDIELNTAGVTEGFTANEYHVAQNLGAKPNQFTLKALEYSGSPIRRAYQYWVSGIRDPRTGVSTYHADGGPSYAAKNHTGELMYIVLRPDAGNREDPSVIEFACYWTAVMPKRIALGHLNWAVATQNVPVEIDMPFSGVMHQGPAVDQKALKLYQGEKVPYYFETEDAYVPGPVGTT
jgi:hypothetical protein